MKHEDGKWYAVPDAGDVDHQPESEWQYYVSLWSSEQRDFAVMLGPHDKRDADEAVDYLNERYFVNPQPQ